MVTSRALTLQAVRGGWKRGEGRRRGAEGGEGKQEERQVGHVGDVDTASSVRRVGKRRGEEERSRRRRREGGGKAGWSHRGC